MKQSTSSEVTVAKMATLIDSEWVSVSSLLDTLNPF